MDDVSVLRGVGPRLRQLRLEREATLTDLAEETGISVITLTRRPGGLQSFKMLLPVDNTPPPTLQTHEGYEWLYVLSGKVRLLLGSRDLVLEPGEVAEFDTRTPHWIGN